MDDDSVLEDYGEVPLHFSHYYNFIFVFKSAPLDDGSRIFLHQGGTMEKVSALVVDADDPLTLEDMTDTDYACIKDAQNQIVWQTGSTGGASEKPDTRGS